MDNFPLGKDMKTRSKEQLIHLTNMESTMDKQINMIGLIILVCLVMSGCGTTGTGGVVEIGPNNYMIGRMGGWNDVSGSAVKARLYAEAKEFCSAKNMVMMPYDSTKKDSALAQYASAEIQFICEHK